MLFSLGHEYKADPKPEALKRVYQQLKNSADSFEPSQIISYMT